ncbi:DUF2059 domain-containing protein [Variovorax sp. VNK109]|uniref:DUF2059 domain-containing protein n=1 Tax=Variovorax sp. VNK109 TaxID=3400919 RepID=UPI003BFF138A
MKYIRFIAASLALTAAVVHAQADARKDLVQKLLQLQQPGVEQLARQLAEQPAAQAAQEAALAIRARVAADKRDAAIKASDAEIKKYLDEAIPFVQQKAVETARTAVGPILEEKFTEDELKQLVAMIDSPVYKKYVQIDPELRNALLRKLVADTKPQIDPKIRTLQANINKIVGVPPQPAAQPAQPAAPAKK